VSVLLELQETDVAVAHDVATESAVSSSEPSFNWSHTGSASAKGVWVITVDFASATHAATAVDYGGQAMTAVTGGEAADTATEPGSVKLWFLSAPPTGTQTVTVTRTNNANSVWAVAGTVTAGTAATEVTGIVLLQEDGALAEQSVDDGSPGANSVRFAGCYTGDLNVPTTGANSTLLHDHDLGPRAAKVVRETTAGQGARSVGCTSPSDDRAAVHFAVREVAGGTPGTASPSTVAAVAAVPSPTAQGAASTSPATVAAVASVPVPSAQGAAVTSPSTVAGIAAVPSPNAQGAAVASPSTVPAIAAVPAPTVSGGEVAGLAEPATVSAIAAVPAPTVGGAAIATGVTVAAVGDIPTPTARGGASVAPGTVQAIAAVPAPTVGGAAAAEPATVVGIALVPSPTVRGGGVASPATVVVIALVPAPNAFGGVLAIMLEVGTAGITRDFASAGVSASVASSAAGGE
jgi:hypothetical protein